MIEAGATEHIGEARYQRTDTRTNQRNGARERLLTTKAGDVELRIHKLRQEQLLPLHLGGSLFTKTWMRRMRGVAEHRCGGLGTVDLPVLTGLPASLLQ